MSTPNPLRDIGMRLLAEAEKLEATTDNITAILREMQSVIDTPEMAVVVRMAEDTQNAVVADLRRMARRHINDI